RLPRAPLGIVQEVRGRPADGRPTVTRRQGAQTLRSPRHRRPLGPEIRAPRLCRPHVGEQETLHLGRQAQRRHDHPFGEDLLRAGTEGVSHRLEPAGVAGHVRSRSTAPPECTVPHHPGSIRAVAFRPTRFAAPAMVTPAARSSSAQTEALTRAPRNVIGRLAPCRWTTRRASAKRGSGPSRSATTRRFTTSTRWSLPAWPNRARCWTRNASRIPC